MRKLVYILLFAVAISACSESESVSDSAHIAIPEITVSKKDHKLTYDSVGRLLVDEKLFSGHLLSFQDDDVLIKKEGYWEGLQEGVALRYYPTGEVFSERYFHKGRKVGTHLGWYQSGARKFVYHFEAGLSVGNHMSWYEDGQLFQNRNYEEGHQKGPQKIYRPDGKIRANYVVRENGRAYGLMGLKRCTKIDSETENIDPYTGIASNE